MSNLLIFPFENLNVCMIKFLLYTIKTIRKYMRAIHNFSMTKIIGVFNKSSALNSNIVIWKNTFIYSRL